MTNSYFQQAILAAQQVEAMQETIVADLRSRGFTVEEGPDGESVLVKDNRRNYNPEETV